jgi:CheY-like chemotaxis protein
MDGIELARTIKADPTHRGVRLVMLSPMGMRGDARIAHEEGIHAYLTKPVSEHLLFDCISTVMGMPADRPSERIVTRHHLGDVQPKLGAHLLLVEDNAVNQEVTVEMLEVLGCRADVAKNGREAVEMMIPGRYDLVFMDCHMPEMDGYRATRIIRDREREQMLERTPIVAMTANAMEGDSDACLAAGMDDYLSKPFSIRQLGAVLERWITPPPA